MIKKFKCGVCNDGTWRSRHALRNHLRDHVRDRFTNSGHEKSKGYIKQGWWIQEEFI